MENFLSVICSSPLFRGIPEEEVTAMLSCLEAKTKSYHKDTFLMRVGDITDCLYIVLSGSILIMQEKNGIFFTFITFILFMSFFMHDFCRNSPKNYIYYCEAIIVFLHNIIIKTPEVFYE